LRRTEPAAEGLRTTVTALRRAVPAMTAAVAHHAAVRRAETAMTAECVRAAAAVVRRATKASTTTHHAARATIWRTGESAGTEIASTGTGPRVPPVGAGTGRLPPVTAVVPSGLRSRGWTTAFRRSNGPAAGHRPCPRAAARVAVLRPGPGNDGVGRTGVAEDLDQLLP
jgi:hypothetical protein